MSERVNIAKAMLSPPGDTIRETIEAIGMSQAELAERIGRPKEKVNDIINGREPISTPTAFQFERVLGIPATFWINREKEYRRQLYELEQELMHEKQYAWIKNFPLNQMQKLGWISTTKNRPELVSTILKYFSIASPEEWKKIYQNKEVSVSFRISLANTNSPFAISAWLRRGELQSLEMEIGEFDKRSFKSALPEIKQLSYDMPEGFASRLQHICAKNGVALVFTENLPKAPISGATRWFRNRPLIQLSGRYKFADHFWFSFFHEVAHILLHGKKDIFLTNVRGTDVDQKKEQEADRFASNMLLKDAEFALIKSELPITEMEIERFSEKFMTHPGVIVGRLQYEKLLPYSFGNQLRVKIKLF